MFMLNWVAVIAVFVSSVSFACFNMWFGLSFGESGKEWQKLTNAINSAIPETACLRALQS